MSVGVIITCGKHHRRAARCGATVLQTAGLYIDSSILVHICESHAHLQDQRPRPSFYKIYWVNKNANMVAKVVFLMADYGHDPTGTLCKL